MFSKIKWHCFGVFIVTFEYIWRFVAAFTVWSCRAGLRLAFLACFDFRISIRHIISNFCNFSISTPPNKNLQKNNHFKMHFRLRWMVLHLQYFMAFYENVRSTSVEKVENPEKKVLNAILGKPRYDHWTESNK